MLTIFIQREPRDAPHLIPFKEGLIIHVAAMALTDWASKSAEELKNEGELYDEPVQSVELLIKYGADLTAKTVGECGIWMVVV